MSWMMAAGAVALGGAVWLYSKYEDHKQAGAAQGSWEYAVADEALRAAVDSAWKREFGPLLAYYDPSLPPQERARRFANRSVFAPWFSLQKAVLDRPVPGGWTVVAQQHLDIAIDLRGDPARPAHEVAGPHYEERLDSAMQAADAALQFDEDDVEAMATWLGALQLAGLPDRQLQDRLVSAALARDPEHWRVNLLELDSHGPRVGRGIDALPGRARTLADGASDGSARHALIARAHSESVVGTWRFLGRGPDAANALATDVERRDEVRAAWARFVAGPALRDESFALTAFAIWFWASEDREPLREALDRLGPRFDGAAWLDWRADPVAAFNEARAEVGLAALAPAQLISA